MYFLKTSASFDSAHFLHGYKGKCANLHGHHWVIEAEFSSSHLHLVPMDFRPTAENFARCFYEKLREKDLPVYRVTVYETPDNCAVYEV